MSEAEATPAPPKRRWFRFGMRTLFVALTLATIITWLATTMTTTQTVRINGGRPIVFEGQPSELAVVVRIIVWSATAFSTWFIGALVWRWWGARNA